MPIQGAVPLFFSMKTEQLIKQGNKMLLIKAIYQDKKPTEEQIDAMGKMYDYIRKNGIIANKDIPENKRELFLIALNKTLKERYNTSIDEVMTPSRQHATVTIRSFCYAAYKDAFPLDSRERIAEIFKNTHKAITIYQSVQQLKIRLKLEEETKRDYLLFNNTIEKYLNN